MDTLGPRIMVNVGTQAVTNPGINPRDLAPLTNDAFLATFMGKPALPTTNGITRQQNNYRQPYSTFRSKGRSTATNGESIEPDSAILSIIRSNGSDNNQPPTQRQFQDNRNYRRPYHQQKFASGWNDIPCSPNYRPMNDFNRQRRTRSGGQQQITVVDQMAAQPNIPYAILPKRFEPKQVSTTGFQQQPRSFNNNNNNYRRHRQVAPAPRRPQRQQNYYDDQWEDVEDENVWPQSANRRRFNGRPPNRNFGQVPTYRGPRQRFNNYYNSYSYGSRSRQGQVPIRSYQRTMYPNAGYAPLNIIPSYDLNEWQGPYARSRRSLYPQQRRGGVRRGRNQNGFIHDDHRPVNSSKQLRNSNKTTTTTHRRKTTKSTKAKGQQKRRTSRKSKKRNENSKSEGTTSTTTTENEIKEEDTQKEEIKPTSETADKPLPPSDNEIKETEVTKPTE